MKREIPEFYSKKIRLLHSLQMPIIKSSKRTTITGIQHVINNPPRLHHVTPVFKSNNRHNLRARNPSDAQLSTLLTVHFVIKFISNTLIPRHTSLLPTSISPPVHELKAHADPAVCLLARTVAREIAPTSPAVTAASLVMALVTFAMVAPVSSLVAAPPPLSGRDCTSIRNCPLGLGCRFSHGLDGEG